MSLIQPKFGVGQKVFCASVTWSQKEVPCPDCLGQAKWKASDPSGEIWSVDCGTCRYGYYSSGKVSDWGDHPKVVELTVGSVRIDTADVERPITYMMEETGVRSGTVYDERNIFATHFEATAFAEEEVLRVKGRRQAQELETRKHKKKNSLIFKPPKKEKTK